MLRNTIILALIGSALFAVGCGGSAPANKAANGNANANSMANMQPDLSATPVASPGNIVPGIPANTTELPKGPTPTPGIPSQKELKKPFKPGATPTPGIPDPDTIRKAMGQQPPPPPAANSNSSMMMMKKKPVNKP